MVWCRDVFALVLSMMIAAPQSGAGARQLVDDAQRAYAKGNYAEAAQLLEQATKVDPSGRILFNLARAYEKANEVEKAIIVYEAYLDRPDAELQALKRARKALADLYRKRPAKPAEPEPPKEVAKEPAPEPVVEAPRHDAPKETVKEPVTTPPMLVPAPSVARPHPLRTVGLISLISGGVVAGVGVGLGLWAQSTAQRAHGTFDPVAKPQLVSQALERATFTDVSFVAAGVLGLTGAVLLLVDWLTP